MEISTAGDETFAGGVTTPDLIATNSTVLSGPQSGTSNVLAVNHGAGSHTGIGIKITSANSCLLYTSPSPRD